MNDNKIKFKLPRGLLGNPPQLVLSHSTMRLVIDSLNFVSILDWSDYAPEINNRACPSDVAPPRRKRRPCDRNFTNDICHSLNLLATVTASALSHETRYKNEHESM
jgi:hypothetical protein